MKDIIRHSSFGQLIRLLIRMNSLRYPDETQDSQNPEGYKVDSNHAKEDNVQEGSYPTSISASNVDILNEEKKTGTATPVTECQDIEMSNIGIRLGRNLSTHVPAERIASCPVVPKRTSDGTILVDWYSTGMRTPPHGATAPRPPCLHC
jgi:DHA1 family multidrug resistance protein-like MFS transporter